MPIQRRGIAIDRQVLARLSGDFAQSAARLEAEIRALAGEDINPGSPKQIGDILFGKMSLPGGKKTKTGAWSTTAAILDELAEQGHEFPRKILDWRQVSKLKSTYTDALPEHVDPQTHRVHTTYALAATTTGRLSSNEPNLQNIPVRTEDGRKIRRAFVATPGHKLVSADYSQIELRLLAEIADIAVLKNGSFSRLGGFGATACTSGSDAASLTVVVGCAGRADCNDAGATTVAAEVAAAPPPITALNPCSADSVRRR